MRNGSVQVIDEVDQMSPEIRCAMNAFMDDLEIAGLTLPTGERVTPADGFAIVCTTNVHPSALHPIIMDRVDVVLRADTPAAGILARLPEGKRTLLANHYARMTKQEWNQPLSVRSMLASERFAPVLGEAEALEMIFGQEAAAEMTVSAAVNVDCPF
jgi:hypothetical protein